MFDLIEVRAMYYAGAWRALVEDNGKLVAISSGSGNCDAAIAAGRALAFTYLNDWSGF